MKLKGDIYFLFVLIALIVAAIILSVRLHDIEAKILPLIIGGFILVLALVVLGTELRKRRKSAVAAAEAKTTKVAAKVEEDIKVAPVGFGRYLIAWAWLLGFFLVIYLLGFIIAIPAFIISYQKSHGTKWLTTIVSAILSTALIYVGFEIGLNVDLYPGLLFQSLIMFSIFF